MNKKKLTAGWAAAIAAIAAAIVAGRGGNHPRPTPVPTPAMPTYTLVVHVCEGAPCDDRPQTHKATFAPVDLNNGQTAKTDGAGNTAFQGLPPSAYTVCATESGYKRACVDVAVPAGGDAYVALEADVPPVLPIHVDGKVFRDAAGAIWPWRGETAFLLLKRFISGEDIGPYLDARRAAGANLVRVLTTVSWGPLAPTDYTDDQLRAFLALAHGHGLRVELVALADAQNWPIGAQRQQAQRIIAVAADAGAVDVVEVANEPFKNSAPPEEIMRGVARRAGVLLSAGDYTVVENQTSLWHLDYVTFHPDRGAEWPRKAKDALELRDGFDWGAHFEGVHVPVVSDEPMGADEGDQPGKRAGRRNIGQRDEESIAAATERVGNDFFFFGATAQLFSPGATFHSTAGITATEPGPITAAAERAFFAGMDAVGPSYQFGMYTRGGLTSVPLEHVDSPDEHGKPVAIGALRTFCMLTGGGDGRCVVIRPETAWSAKARDGWRITATTGPRGSVLTVVR